MKKILLLEDNSFDADLVSRELKKKWPNLVLNVVSRISEARALFTDDTVFDIAIFDLNLPDGNGLDLLVELRNKDFQTPIIVYTSVGSEEIVSTALKSGANDYVSKKTGYEKQLPEQIEFTLNQTIKYKKTINVLYIEHHKADIELTNHYLKKHAPHIQITNVSDGDIALDILPKNKSLPCKYDLILLDYKLPGLNALEIIKIIRQERKLFIPIVIVTGQGDETIAAKALKIGADNYVVKKEQYLLHLPSIIMNSYQHKELERQQHALKLSELKFRLLADYSSEWEYWLNQDKEYIYNSPICEKTTGYKHEDFVNNKNLLSDIALPEYKTLIADHYSENIIELHNPIEFKIKTLDGTIKWISHFCRAVYDDDKNYLGQRGVNRDVTEHKKQVEMLLKLNKAIANSSDIIFMTNVEGIITYINPVFTKKYGYSPDEIIGKVTPRILNSGNHPPEVYSRFWANLKQRKNINSFHFINKSKDGKQIDIEASASAIIDGKDKIIGFIGIQRDITQRKLAEKALADSEEKHRLYVDKSPQGIFILDLEGNYIDVNPEACKMTGYSKEEILTLSLQNLAAPQDLKEIMHAFKILIEKGENKGDFLFQKKNGTVFYGSIEAIVLPGDRIMGYCSDVTEKRRVELIQKIILNISNASQTLDDLVSLLAFIQKELGRVVDTTNFYIALFNEKEKTISLPFFSDENNNFKEVSVSNSLIEYMIKTQKTLLVSKEQLTVLVANNGITIKGPAPEIWLGVPLISKRKVIGAVVVQSYTNPNAYKEKDKEMLEIISSQISISIERKRYEEELIKAMEKAEESDRLKTAFLANMSHEIRTPMNGILGFSSLLKQPELSGDKQKKYIEIIEKSGQRMLNTINDIIDISRIESNQTQLSIQEIDIAKELNELFYFFKQQCHDKGLVLNLDNQNNFILKNDGVKLNSVFTNLIKNAIKFTDKGEINIGYAKKGNFLEFYVKDTGIGIPVHRQKAVFNRFEQADIEDKKAMQGSGLGLAITKAYVEMLGGNIWLESQVEQGSVFYFTIPLNEELNHFDDLKKEDFLGFENDTKKRLNVLIAENDEQSNLFLNILVEPISKNIFSAKSGIDTLEIFKKNQDIDLILMDVQMPGMDGLEVTRQIRKFNKNTIIIAQTAFAFTADEKMAIDAGCDAYLSKPVKKEKLMNIINRFFK